MNAAARTWFYLAGWLLLAVAIVTPFFCTYDRSASLKAALVRPDGKILKAFFTPYDNIKEVLIALINNEEQAIDMMAYLLSDKHVISALQEAAYVRHIAVTIIVDHDTATNEKYNRTLKKLAQYVTLRVFQELNDGIMHNKFVIFAKNINQQSIVWTGSFNFTARAQHGNIENALVSNDPELVAQYQKAFKSLYSFSVASDQVFNAHTIRSIKPAHAVA